MLNLKKGETWDEHLSEFQKRLFTSQAHEQEMGICKGTEDESWVLASAARVFVFSMPALENQASASITKRLFGDPGRKEILVLLKALAWIGRWVLRIPASKIIKTQEVSFLSKSSRKVYTDFTIGSNQKFQRPFI